MGRGSVSISARSGDGASHGHWDHAGGLPKAIEMVRAANGGQPVPLHLHPGMFRERGSRQPDGGVLPMDRVPAPADWVAMGAVPQVSREPAVIAGHVLVSGEIPRVTAYETGLPGQVAREDDAAPWQPDEWLAMNASSRCICAARGWWSSPRVRIAASSMLHEARRLMPRFRCSRRWAASTCRARMNASFRRPWPISAASGCAGCFPHCTGWRALNALERAHGEAVVVPGAVGKTSLEA